MVPSDITSIDTWQTDVLEFRHCTEWYRTLSDLMQLSDEECYILDTD